MPLGGIFSPSSETQSVPTAFNTGFSEIGGPAYSVNLNVAGKVGKRATVAPVINLTDQGALARAAEISAQSQRSVQELGGTLADAIARAFSATQQSTAASIAAVSESQRGEVENISLSLVKWGALAAAAYFAARIFWKG